jgi:hypothetical protein
MRRGLAEGILRVKMIAEESRCYVVSQTYAVGKCRVFNERGVEGGGGARRNLTICHDIDFQITAVSFRAHASSRMKRKGNGRQEKDEENED